MLRMTMRVSILHVGHQPNLEVIEGYRRALATEFPPDWHVDTRVAADIGQALQLLESERCCSVDIDDVAILQAISTANPRALEHSLLADLFPNPEAFLREHGLGGGIECNLTLLDEDWRDPRHKDGRVFLRIDLASRIAKFEEAKKFMATLCLPDVNGYTIIPLRPGRGVLRWCFAALAATAAPTTK